MRYCQISEKSLLSTEKKNQRKMLEPNRRKWGIASRYIAPTYQAITPFFSMFQQKPC